MINLTNRYFRSIVLCLIIFIFLTQRSIAQNELDLDNYYTEVETKIDSLSQIVQKANRFIEKLDSATLYNLPLGIMAKGTDPSYSILIDEVVMKPDRAYFNASMMLTCPTDGSKIAFKAEKVPLTKSGGLADPIKLELVSKHNIRFSKDIVLTILPGSYVEWDCSGFKALQVKGKLSLSKGTFIPVDAQGKDITQGQVSANFETTVNNWNNLAFSVSLDPFRINKIPDIFFECKDIAVDLSDYTNPTVLVFPDNYQSLYPEGSINLWRGLFIGKAEIKLGKKFQKKNATQLTTFSATNLLIDENGFTGALAATNLFTLSEGDMNGWGFSLEKIDVKLQQSQLTSASLDGKLKIPGFKENTHFAYHAFMDNDGNYNFKVNPGSNLSFTLFGSSKLVLYQTSFIEIKSEEDKFVPTANLSGDITISCSLSGNDADSTKKEFQLAEVKFEEMRISSVEPMFSVKNFAFSGSSPGTFSKFPFTISNIGIRSEGNNFHLDFTAAINLTKSSDEGFSGQTSLTLNSEFVDRKFKFKGIQVREIRIDIVKPKAFELHGQIMFARGDSIYGNGFRGALRAKFGDKFELGAVAVFGNVNGNRYFFTDAMFAMKPGIQAGPITLFGFSGGLYQHMRQKTGAKDSNSFGASLSGLVYEPDPSIGIGIMAGVQFGVCSEKIIKAEAKFEIVFNSSGGLNRISFEGNAQCITPEIPIDAGKVGALAGKLTGGKKLEFVPEGAISLNLSMLLDFENDVFHAEFAAYVNVGSVIKGVGENGKAGWGVVHITKDEWYVYIGTPTDPIGLNLLGFVKIGGYFMMGHGIPTELPMNPKVAQILNLPPPENKDMNEITSGRGIAFGAFMEINTGDLTFLIFYASFQFGAGFDIMLVDYGNGAHCEGSAPPLGINGWYAKGQVYAYLDGKIGIKVKVFGIRKTFDILSLSAAILFRAQGPNPLYMVGYAGGQFSVLGGLVKGKCNFKVEVGNKCKIIAPESGLEDLKLISEITPGDKAQEIDVFTIPQVIFNVPVNKEINITNDANIKQKFRAKLNKCELTSGTQSISCISTWNNDKNVLVLEPTIILNPKTDYQIYAEVGFEEYKNGRWEIFQEGGQNVVEKRNVTFKTGDLPDKIPSTVIEYTYPVNRQYNFYTKEYNQAYIKFRRDIAPFVTPTDTRNVEIQWIASNGSKTTSSLTYSGAEKMLTVDIPVNLSKSTIYSFNLVSIPKDKNQGLDKNVTTKTKEVLKDSATSVDIANRESTGVGLTNTEEKTMYTINFRTSIYDRFKDKLSGGNKRVTFLEEVAFGDNYIGTNLNNTESYDKLEIIGNDGVSPLIRIYGVLANTPWFVDEVKPLLYSKSEILQSNSIVWRDTSICGLPPYKDIQIWQTYAFKVLEDNEIATGILDNKSGVVDLVYTLSHYWSKDYYDIRDYLAYSYTNHPTDDPVFNKILENRMLRPIKPGNYALRADYVLPGLNKVTSSVDITMNNGFKTSLYD